MDEAKEEYDKALAEEAENNPEIKALKEKKDENDKEIEENEEETKETETSLNDTEKK